ncbi:hypothetical protein TNCV_4876211 [Trichonephila clavipes]|uniref:Uncharacterized protein n=1 Tax=Trichonephila clavipes TaxID=2585209 RepID=A0A8X6RHR0_TRICX|nr:hypothetical protein TNCV_4876211 [Trichonephila clavipes]
MNKPTSKLYISKILVEPLNRGLWAAVAQWLRYPTMAGMSCEFDPSTTKDPLFRQRCTLNLSRAETSSRWCGVVVRRGGASSGVVHVT